jgi:hypothetical protein
MQCQSERLISGKLLLKKNFSAQANVANEVQLYRGLLCHGKVTLFAVRPSLLAGISLALLSPIVAMQVSYASYGWLGEESRSLGRWATS